MLYRPASRREALIFKGTRLEYFWNDDSQGWAVGYYNAWVVKVPYEPVEGDEDGIYFCLEFADQAEGRKEAWHDIEWADFADPEQCRISWLPDKAIHHQLRQRKLAEQKGKALAGVQDEDAHAHLFAAGVSNSGTARPAKKQCLARQAEINGFVLQDRGRMPHTSPVAGKFSSSYMEGTEADAANRFPNLKNLQNGGDSQLPNRHHSPVSGPGSDSDIDIGSDAPVDTPLRKPKKRRRRPEAPTHVQDEPPSHREGDEVNEASADVRQASPQAPPRKKRHRDIVTALEASCERDVGSFVPVETGNGRGNAGHVKRLVLENFMCHEHLAVDFGPRMNFVCGENGSGKTAVLHGLQMCLGVSAKQSGRASTGADFIRDGSRYCKGAATLWNTGGDAYLPRKYGSEITIIREMKKTTSGASSTWAVLDAKGKKMASKKVEVEDLLRALNVNAANPLVCLTQDTARSFGGSKAEAELFRIYMEALQFDRVIENLALARPEIDIMSSRLKDKMKANKAEAAKEKEVSEKLEQMDEVKTLEAQNEHIGNCIVWECYVENKKAAEKCDALLQGQAKEKMEELVAKRTAAEEKVQAANANRDDQAAAIADFPQRMKALQDEFHAQQQLYQAARKDCTRVAKDLRGLSKAVQEKQTHVATLQESISEMRNQLAETSQDESQALAVALKQKLDEAEAAKAAVSEARQEVKVAQAIQQEAIQKSKACDKAKNDSAQHVTSAQHALARLQEQQGGNPLASFGGQGVVQLVNAIARAVSAGRFDRPPLGPLGSLLTLKEDKWAVAVEASIGRAFGNFIVHSHKDAQLAKELARRFFPGHALPSLTIHSFDTPEHNLNRQGQRQVPEGLPTVLRVLQIKDSPYSHIVKNVLLDNHFVERLLLVQSEKEGMEAVRGDLGQHRVITSAWARDGWHGINRGRTTTSFPRRGPLTARLCKDMAGALREVQAELTSLQGVLQQKQQALNAARIEERAAGQAVDEAKRRVVLAVRSKEHAERQVDDLRTQQEAETQIEEASLAELELQLVDAEAQVTSSKREVEEKQAVLDEARQKEAGEKASLDDKKRVLDEHLKLNEAEVANQEAAARKVEEAEAELQHVHDQFSILKDKIATLEEKKADFLAKSKAKLAPALEQCSEEEYKESTEILAEGLLKRRQGAEARGATGEDLFVLALLAKWQSEVERKIAAREQDVGASADELERQLQIVQKALQQGRKEEDAIRANLMLLTEAFNARKLAARQMRKAVEHAVSNSFNQYLNQRGFTGSISFDKEEGTLSLKVRPDSRAREAVTDMRSLSGGERSFTNLCFIMAVGQQISSPFHCLDEFDVFMDAINRQKSMDMLIRFGAIYEHLQFILLTPQGTEAVDGARSHVQKALKEQYPQGDFINMFKMPKPRQNRNRH